MAIKSGIYPPPKTGLPFVVVAKNGSDVLVETARNKAAAEAALDEMVEILRARQKIHAELGVVRNPRRMSGPRP